MKNILFISLLVNINVLVISCLPPNNQEKCNKFLDDHHNPLAKKVDDIKIKANNFSNKAQNAILTIFTRNQINTMIITMTETEIFNNMISKLKNEPAAKNRFKSQFLALETSLNDYNAAVTSAITALDEAIKGDDTVCKNSSLTVTKINKKMPGESGYKDELEKVKKDYETVLKTNTDKFNQIKQAL